MKTFYHYLAEAKKQYDYKIKLVSEVTDEVFKKIERAIAKYEVLEISKPRKTILQSRPLDFSHLDVAEIWIIDVTTHLPAVSYVMMQEIRTALNISENDIVVRGANEPVELERDRLEHYNQDIKNKAALLTTPIDDDAFETEPAYGDAYNTKLLNYLAQVQSERPKPKDIEANKNGLFKWLDDVEQTPVDNSEFTKDYPGVRPVYKKPGKDVKAPAEVGPSGNFQTARKGK